VAVVYPNPPVPGNLNVDGYLSLAPPSSFLIKLEPNPEFVVDPN